MSQRLPHIWSHPGMWELREAFDSRACYKEHLHDTLSVGQILSGESICSMNGEKHRLREGDVICIPAFSLHACNPLDASWAYRMLHVSGDFLAMNNLSGPQKAGLAANTKSSVGYFDQLVEILKRGEPESILEAEAPLVELLHSLEVLPWADSKLAARTATKRELEKVFEYLREHAAEPVALAALAALVGLDSWQLLRGFQRIYRMTPHSLQQSLRVQRARHWIQEGMPLSEVALRAGFSDQSHFSNVFKRHTSLSPGAYRKALKSQWAI